MHMATKTRNTMSNLIKRILAVVVWTFAYASFAFELSVNKTPLTTIVIPEDAAETVRLAAKELHDFVYRCNGTELVIAEESPAEGGNIFVGGHDELLGDVPAQGFRIISRNGNLYIIGHDYKGEPIVGLRNPWNYNEVFSPTLKIGAFGSCGSLHGVYYFLEKFCGVRFFWPGEVGTVIPERHDIVLNDVNEMQYPKLHYRHTWVCNFDQSEENVLWYKRAGFGGDAPVQIIDYFMYVTSKLQNEHPEFFALVDGERDFGDKCAIRGGGHLCFNATGVKEAVAELIVQYFREHPEQNTFPLAPGDGLRRCCECPLCKAEYENEPEGTGHFSNHIWRFVNDVAKLVEKECPDKIVGCLAYEQYRDVPSKIEHLNSNVGVMLVYDRSLMPNTRYAKKIRDTVESWHGKLTNSLYSWNWYLRGCPPWRRYPVVFVRSAQRDIQYMLKNGWAGEFIEAENWTDSNEPHRMLYPGTFHLNLYVTGKLYWNPDLDLNALLDDYCSSFYGPAATEMRQFFDLASERWEMVNANAANYTGKQAAVEPETVYDYESLCKLWGYIEAALTKVSDDSQYAVRIKTIKEEFGHARAALLRMFRTERPEMKVVGAEDVLQIDGYLTENIWSAGESALMVKKSGEPAIFNTQIYCRKDGRNLYFGFTMEEPKLDKLHVGNPGLAKDVWADDCIEIFLEMGETGKGYMQYDINSDGKMMAFFRSEDGYIVDVTSSSKAVAASGRGTGGWTVEFAVPLEELKLDKKKLKANFLRSRVVDEYQTFDAWAPVFSAGNYAPEYFGTLVLE